MIADRPGPRVTPRRLTAMLLLLLLTPLTVIAVALAMTASPARAASKGHIYWVEDDTGDLGRADLDGTNVVNPFIGIYSNPGRVAVDSEYIYWAAPDANRIERAELDGENVEEGFIATGEESYPEGLAIYEGHIYWTGENNKTIGRAELDGENVEQSFIQLSTWARGLTVGPDGIYWAYGAGKDMIGHAELGGGNVDESFIETGHNPQEVVVDSEHIYWTNADDNTIGRAELDGKNVEQSFIADLSSPWGLAIDSSHLYWTNLYDEAIGRAELDGKNVEDSFVKTGAGPSGLAVSPTVKATPTLTTAASPGITLGGTAKVEDTATLAGGLAAGGTITFRLYGPEDASCAGPVAHESTVPVSGDGGYPSGEFAPTAAGTYRWVAEYSGDADNEAASSICVEASTVDKAVPTVVLAAPAGSLPGRPVTVTASVAGFAATGTVTFRDGADTLGSAVVGAGGQASFTTGPFAPGTHQVTASYAGDADNASADSPPMTIVVAPLPRATVSYGPNTPHRPNRKGGPRWTFVFADEAPNVTFYCRLDKAPFTPCHPPRVYRHLRRGRHVFCLKSVDAAGNASPVEVVHFFAGRHRRTSSG